MALLVPSQLMTHWLAAPEISLFFPRRAALDTTAVSRSGVYFVFHD